MRVYFEIDEKTLDGVKEFLTLFNGIDKDVIENAIKDCEEKPVEIPAAAKGLIDAVGSHFAAAMIAVKLRILSTNYKHQQQ